MKKTFFFFLAVAKWRDRFPECFFFFIAEYVCTRMGFLECRNKHKVFIKRQIVL